MVYQLNVIFDILEFYKGKPEGGKVRFLTTTGKMIPFEFPPIEERPLLLPSEKRALLRHFKKLLS